MLLASINTAWIEILLRAGALTSGGILIYSSVFLYEDEQGKLQNKLEEWWVSLKSESDTAISKHGAILRGAADFTTRVFDRFFGKRLLSAQAFIVSVGLAFGVGGSSAIFWSAPEMPFGVRFVYLVGGSICIAMVLAGRIGRQVIRAELIGVLTIFGLLFVVMLVADPWDAGVRYGIMYLVIGACILCDWLVIALSRWMLRWTSDIRRTIPLVTILVTNLCLAFVFVAGPLIMPGGKFLIDKNWGESAGLLLARSNLGNAVVASAWAVLVAVALLHRLAWPIVIRPLYAIQNLGIERRRKFFFGLGIALLILGGLKVPEALRGILSLP